MCSRCGVAMNHHAEKLVEPLGAADAAGMDLTLGGLVEEMHCCPRCGGSGSRLATGSLQAWLVAALLALLASRSDAGPAVLREELWETNGRVAALALSENTLYVGIGFSCVGPAGLYFYRVQAGREQASGRMLLVR